MSRSRATHQSRAAAVTSRFDSVAPVDSAIDAVTEQAGVIWRDYALDAVRAIARTRPTLTADDVRHRLTILTYDVRALGGVMREAAHRGWITAEPSTRVTSNKRDAFGHRLRVWRSRIFEGER